MMTENGGARFQMKLGVIGASPHYRGPDGTPWAYEPYVREMRVWADLFASVVVFGAAGEGVLKGNLAPYDRKNVAWHPVSYSLQTYGYRGVFKRSSQFPGLVAGAWRTIRRSDFILLRSPNHFGLVGAVLVRMMNMPSITKWAGENGAYQGERLPTRLDRYVENRPSDRHHVLVYGPPRRTNQISFFPALMLDEELSRAKELGKARTWAPPWRILCVGRLERAKGFDLAIRGLAELKKMHPMVPWTFTLIGDGAAREELRSLVCECGLQDQVTFTGPLSFMKVQEYYGESHIVVMPGVKEGWPKIVAEAWAHGAIPVAASAGLVPWILSDENSGVAFDGSPASLAKSIVQLLENPERMKVISGGLHRFAESLSLDQFKVRLEQVLVERCGLH